ncbi:DNA recombination protein RmuC [Babesia caballi]|uniref:DNA recombination protein RmuC n=1 Tax=Babesia caballi TaxID=5871 RepID=A0AAV4M1F0_BABCB|nr:DNA recombination protein RmuC [Babesia caballi]
MRLQRAHDAHRVIADEPAQRCRRVGLRHLQRPPVGAGPHKSAKQPVHLHHVQESLRVHVLRLHVKHRVHLSQHRQAARRAGSAVERRRGETHTPLQNTLLHPLKLVVDLVVQVSVQHGELVEQTHRPLRRQRRERERQEALHANVRLPARQIRARALLYHPRAAGHGHRAYPLALVLEHHEQRRNGMQRIHPTRVLLVAPPPRGRQPRVTQGLGHRRSDRHVHPGVNGLQQHSRPQRQYVPPAHVAAPEQRIQVATPP